MKDDYCSLCEEVRIIGYGEDHRPMALPEHREHFIEMNIGSLLCVGVCSSCKASLIGKSAKKNADTILESHKKRLREVTGLKSDFESLAVVDPNTSESDYRMKRIRGEMEQKTRLAEQVANAEVQLSVYEKKRLEDEMELERKKREYEDELTRKSEEPLFYD